MNYRQTLDYLYDQLPMFHRVGAAAYKADLNNTTALCQMLGQPEKGFLSVHIAGTNGKGSTSHLLASVLQSAGYKTGLFTSPHLKDFRERIRINGKKIPKSFITSFVNQHRVQFEPIRPSFFEYTAVMAFQYFKEAKVDIAVIETGMGGRLDSTNVITPLLGVITNISKDHMAYLGNTLQKIAVEKAGIIKPAIPVVIGESQPATMEIFIQRAAEMNSPVLFADKHYKIIKDPEVKDQFFLIPGDGIPIQCPLKGIYQEKNLVTAYQAIQILKNQRSGNGNLVFKITEEHIRAGFRNVIKLTGLQGRWQVLRQKPKVICDVGHNEAGIRSIIKQLRSESYDTLHWVFGMVNDKDTDHILNLLPQEAQYYFCKADIPRGLDANELKQKAEQSGLSGNVYPSVSIAYESALKAAGENDLVFIGGSTFVVAEVL